MDSKERRKVYSKPSLVYLEKEVKINFLIINSSCPTSK
jgi:hypothetical protein